MALAASITFAAPPDGKGKPKDDPPPVQYEYFLVGTLGGEDSYIYDINDRGIAVGTAQMPDGSSRAVLVRPLGSVDAGGMRSYENLIYDGDGDGICDSLEDLNVDEFNNPRVWVDSAGHSLVNQNWIATGARAINQYGEIVGDAIETMTGTGETRVFRYDPDLDELMLLPTVGDGDHFGRGVNDSGDIVGYRNDQGTEVIFYHWDDQSSSFTGLPLSGISVTSTIGSHGVNLNNRDVDNNVQIVTRAAVRVTLHVPTESWTTEMYDPRFFIYCVNDAGRIGGWARSTGQKGKNKPPEGAFLSWGNPSEELVIVFGGSFVTDLNEAGDAIVGSGAAFLYKDLQTLNLADFTPNHNPGFAWAVNERDDTSGFPQVAGQTTISVQGNELFRAGFIMVPTGP